MAEGVMELYMVNVDVFLILDRSLSHQAPAITGAF